MQGTLARDESGNNNDAMLINGAEIVYEGGKCDSGVSLLGKLKFVSFSISFCPLNRVKVIILKLLIKKT